MTGDDSEAAAGRTAALTPEEAHALSLAAELRDRIQRERETAQLLGAFLEINTTDAGGAA